MNDNIAKTIKKLRQKKTYTITTKRTIQYSKKRYIVLEKSQNHVKY